jgi:hypothetical protein
MMDIGLCHRDPARHKARKFKSCSIHTAFHSRQGEPLRGTPGWPRAMPIVQACILLIAVYMASVNLTHGHTIHELPCSFLPNLWSLKLFSTARCLTRPLDTSCMNSQQMRYDYKTNRKLHHVTSTAYECLPSVNALSIVSEKVLPKIQSY